MLGPVTKYGTWSITIRHDMQASLCPAYAIASHQPNSLIRIAPSGYRMHARMSISACTVRLMQLSPQAVAHTSSLFPLLPWLPCKLSLAAGMSGCFGGKQHRSNFVSCFLTEVLPSMLIATSITDSGSAATYDMLGRGAWSVHTRSIIRYEPYVYQV